MGYSPAVVSMRVKRLESVTGKTLFYRSTRHIALTEEGEVFLALAQQTLDLAELMQSSTYPKASSQPLEGSVRITSPHSFARVFLLAPIQQLLEQHPRLSINLLLADDLTELVKEGIDISFRVGGEPEPSMHERVLLEDRRILVASPLYLHKQGVPQTAAELKDHQCLSYSHMKQWVLESAGQTSRVNLQQVLYCNTGDYLSKLAVAGAGITVKSDWSVREELESGALQQILSDYSLGPVRQIRALTPRRDVMPVRVQQVLELLCRHIEQVANAHAAQQKDQ